MNTLEVQKYRNELARRTWSLPKEQRKDFLNSVKAYDAAYEDAQLDRLKHRIDTAFHGPLPDSAKAVDYVVTGNSNGILVSWDNGKSQLMTEEEFAESRFQIDAFQFSTKIGDNLYGLWGYLHPGVIGAEEDNKFNVKPFAIITQHHIRSEVTEEDGKPLSIPEQEWKVGRETTNLQILISFQMLAEKLALSWDYFTREWTPQQTVTMMSELLRVLPIREDRKNQR